MDMYLIGNEIKNFKTSKPTVQPALGSFFIWETVTNFSNVYGVLKMLTEVHR